MKIKCAECKTIEDVFWHEKICLYLCSDCAFEADEQQRVFEREEGIKNENHTC